MHEHEHWMLMYFDYISAHGITCLWSKNGPKLLKCCFHDLFMVENVFKMIKKYSTKNRICFHNVRHSRLCEPEARGHKNDVSFFGRAS